MSVKVFSSGNLKKYLLIGAASVLMAGTPKEASAQDAKGSQIEKFDFKTATSEQQKMFNATSHLLSLKYGADIAQDKTENIMSAAMKLEGESKQKLFVMLVVERVMGKDYKAMMTAAKADVVKEREDIVSRDTTLSQKGDMIIDTTIGNKFGIIKKKTVNGENSVEQTTVSNQVFKWADLTPSERREFNLIKAKIEMGNLLRGKRNLGTMSKAQVVFMAAEEDKKVQLKMYTRGILFRDVDKESFVAYNPSNQQWDIFASTNKKDNIRKAIKKAGGIENYVLDDKEKTSTKISSRAIGLRLGNQME